MHRRRINEITWQSTWNSANGDDACVCMRTGVHILPTITTFSMYLVPTICISLLHCCASERCQHIKYQTCFAKRILFDSIVCCSVLAYGFCWICLQAPLMNGFTVKREAKNKMNQHYFVWQNSALAAVDFKMMHTHTQTASALQFRAAASAAAATYLDSRPSDSGFWIENTNRQILVPACIFDAKIFAHYMSRMCACVYVCALLQVR